LAPSHEVNGILFGGAATWNLNQADWFDVFEYPVDPEADPAAALADHGMQFGDFWWGGLSRDDLGGLRYLLSTNTVNLETLLPDVHGTGTNTGNFVQVALRPGVEKITFVPQQYDSLSAQAVPITNQFVDTYITNNIAKHQLLERVITRPDFLFSAGDVGDAVQNFARTGTTNWWNSATVKSSTNQVESGLIVPPVNISFDRLGAGASTSDNYTPYVYATYWGTFDDSTNAPIVYPTTSKFEGADFLSIHLRLYANYYGLKNRLHWKVPVPLGGTAMLQTSTNLIDWVSVGTTTNVTGSLLWDHNLTQQKRFFRVVPQ
jgi:hypothetical protein